MDALVTSVIRLHEQGLSERTISDRLKISGQKVSQILITAGLKTTAEAELQASGLTSDEIAVKLGKSRKAVLSRLPYSKGQYRSEYPTVNALRIRQCRKEQK